MHNYSDCQDDFPKITMFNSLYHFFLMILPKLNNNVKETMTDVRAVNDRAKNKEEKR